jgi:hypothetical protein
MNQALNNMFIVLIAGQKEGRKPMAIAMAKEEQERV